MRPVGAFWLGDCRFDAGRRAKRSSHRRLDYMSYYDIPDSFANHLNENLLFHIRSFFRTTRLRHRDRFFHLGFVVKPFRYLRDPLCLAAIALYALNRWVAKPSLSSAFLHNHFNDLLLIPAALPGVLWAHRRFGWRTADTPPSGWEIAFHGAVWSVICEGIGPYFFHRGTADLQDVLAYAVGALMAWLWWHRQTSPLPADA